MPPHQDSSYPDDDSSQSQHPSGSSAEDYRSVIDDLTLEIQGLKKELERCRRSGPNVLHQDKLFEVKVHGLPQDKKTELEAMLRNIAIGANKPPDASSSVNKETTPNNRDDMNVSSGIERMPAPFSPPNFPRIDSAYTSISTGSKSPNTHLNPPTLTSANISKGKVEDYLRDIPQSLYPQHVSMTDKDRKGVVVGRLEQLFMDKIAKRQHIEVPPGHQIIQDVYVDSEGWVYLNLLCNLAQLHMINVTPDFVRSAVSEISSKLQLSHDGHKIRWRVESQEPKLDSSQRSPSTNKGSQYKDSSKDTVKSDLERRAQLQNFRYKPLFAQHKSSGVSCNEAVYRSVVVDGDYSSDSSQDVKAAGTPVDKSQQRVGSITYYSGAPFCIDLSRDPNDTPPRSLSSDQLRKDFQQSSEYSHSPRRTKSGSFTNYRPLTDPNQDPRQQVSAMDIDSTEDQHLSNSDSEKSNEIKLDLMWSDDQQYIVQQPLVPSGLGGVLPEDHFTIVVNTKRPKEEIVPNISISEIETPNQCTERVMDLQAKTSACLGHQSSENKPVPETPKIEIEFTSGYIKRLTPVPLPPPALFFPLSNSDSSFTSGEGTDSMSCS